MTDSRLGTCLLEAHAAWTELTQTNKALRALVVTKENTIRVLVEQNVKLQAALAKAQGECRAQP